MTFTMSNEEIHSPTDEVARLRESVTLLKSILSQSFTLFTEMEKAIRGQITADEGLATIEQWLEEIQPEVERWLELKEDDVPAP